MSAPPDMQDIFSGGFTDEDEEPINQDGYRREIEDIVKGFIIEKELLLQGHQEEMSRMRDQFSSERSGLCKQFEMQKDELLRSSKMSSNSANETGVPQFDDFHASSAQAYGLSSQSSGASAQGFGNFSPRKSRQFHDHASTVTNSNLAKEMADDIEPQASHATFDSSHPFGADAQGSVNSPSQGYVRHTSDAVDLNLVKEIAEVYMRMNSGAMASQVRPDLDFEDKFERERDALERRLQLEKRQVKRKLEEDYNRKLEHERSTYEEQIQELKTVNSDLQWRKRDLENRLRLDKEKWQLDCERERNDFEKKQVQSVHDIKRKLEEKHTVELRKQRQKYEENTSELQADITKLTAELRELNENLTQEKDIIMIKFEREIKEMEQAFIDQRNALKLSLESEFMIILENETTILKTVNGKLKEDVETLEREKKDVERKYKDERHKAEENHDEEISEMERRHSEDKRNIKTRYEERFQQLLERDKATLDETVIELTEEVVALREENSQIELALNERNEELRQQIELERLDARQTLMSTRDEIKAQLEAEYSQRILIATASREDQSKQQDRDNFTMKQKYEEIEMKLASMRGEKDRILREKEQLQKKINGLESDLGNHTDKRTGVTSSKGEIETLRGILSAKETEVASVKAENQELEINLSAVKRQRMDLEDEITALKRKLSQASSDVHDERRTVDNSELVSLQEALRRKEEDVRILQKGTFDADSKQASWQRKNEELEDELATMRRKKLEVEDEISALKRDKADLDSRFTSLRKEKTDFEELFMNLKRKTTDLEDTMSATKRDKMDLQHEISLLKKLHTTMEVDTQRVHYDNHELATAPTQQRVRKEPNTERSSCFLEDQAVAASKKEANELQTKIRELTETKRELEDHIVKLDKEKEDFKTVGIQGMTKEIMSDLENQDAESSESTWILGNQQEELKQNISILKEEHLDLESKLSHLRREEARIGESCQDLKQTRDDLEEAVKTLKYDKNALMKEIENIEREKVKQDRYGVQLTETVQQMNNASQYKQTNNPNDKEITRLTSEKQDLLKEISTVKKQLALLQSEMSTTKSVHVTQEALQIDEKEISRLKKSRLELERQIAVLKRQKTEIEAEITVIGEVKNRQEKDLASLRRERVDIDIQMTALQCQRTRLEAEMSMMRDDRKKNENEIETLRKEKTSMEKQVYGIQSQKLKLESDVETVADDWRKKGNEVSGLSCDVTDAVKQLELLRREKADLQTEIIRLQSSKSTEESDITSIRRQKQDLELQMSQLKTQTDTIRLQSSKSKDESEIISVRRQKQDLELQMSQLKTQTDNIRLQSSKSKDESEIISVRRQKQDLERQMSQLNTQTAQSSSSHSPRYHAHSSNAGHDNVTTEGMHEHSRCTDGSGQMTQLNTETAQSSSSHSPRYHAHSSKAGHHNDAHYVTTEGMHEHSRCTDGSGQMTQLNTQTVQSSSSHSPRYHAHSSKAGHDNDAHYVTTEGMHEHSRCTEGSGGLFSSRVVVNGLQGHGVLSSSGRDHRSSGEYLSSRSHAGDDQDEQEEQIPQRHAENSVSTNVQIHRYREVSGLSSYGRDGGHSSDHLARFSRNDGHNDGRFSQAPLGSQEQRNGYSSHVSSSLNSSTFHSHDTIKEDNDVASLRKERQDLQLEISELRIELTKMQTEMENTKTVLETNVSRKTVTTSVQEVPQFSTFREESKIIEARMEDRRDAILQEYEHQIKELKQRKLELEQKVSVLEWQLENTKQKMEIQEMSHRRELSSTREKILSTGVNHSLTDREAQKLKAFYNRVSFLLVKRNGSSEEIMKEVKMEMKNLNQKVDLQYKSMSDFQSMSSSVTMEEGKFHSTTRGEPGQLRTQLEAADEQLKTCETIIQRLYGENEDLSKVISKMESKLKSASRTEEKLQRKKVLLQKLVEQLSGHVEKDALHQSYLVVELDKDVSV